ncbi:MAG TPA: glucosamine-6-phosphate deaminase [Thermoanaerobaculia bacterium]|nr:glucosamine-6-phosphate deaminase [Thermoanaerobaculia bacterium]
MKWEPCPSSDALSERAAHLLLDAIRADPRIVLGLPTGRTPIGMYQRVVGECSRAYHCFRDVTAFNLDEYVEVPREHPASYFSYMKRHLFDHVDVDPANTHIPDGNAADLDAECHRYESEIRDAGGLALTFLGLGRNGHIGFNEPGTPFDSRTRLVELTQSTRHANASDFPDAHVPSHAITMGIGTILESRAIVLLVAGTGKEEAVQRLQSRVLDPAFPASALWMHSDVTVLVTSS